MGGAADRGSPAPQRRPQSRQSLCCPGAAAELGSQDGLSPPGALVPTDRTLTWRVWAGEEGLQPQGQAGLDGPQGHTAHPGATHSCTLWPHDLSPAGGAQGPRDGCAGAAPPERGREGPCVPHPAPRSSVPPARPPQMQWDKAAETEGRRALLPPWLPSFGELQVPTGLGTGSGGRKGLPVPDSARPGRTPGEAAAPIPAPERRAASGPEAANWGPCSRTYQLPRVNTYCPGSGMSVRMTD